MPHKSMANYPVALLPRKVSARSRRCHGAGNYIKRFSIVKSFGIKSNFTKLVEALLFSYHESGVGMLRL